jgi:hypothetical protein
MSPSRLKSAEVMVYVTNCPSGIKCGRKLPGCTYCIDMGVSQRQNITAAEKLTGRIVCVEMSLGRFIGKPVVKATLHMRSTLYIASLATL